MSFIYSRTPKPPKLIRVYQAGGTSLYVPLDPAWYQTQIATGHFLDFVEKEIDPIAGVMRVKLWSAAEDRVPDREISKVVARCKSKYIVIPKSLIDAFRLIKGSRVQRSWRNDGIEFRFFRPKGSEASEDPQMTDSDRIMAILQHQSSCSSNYDELRYLFSPDRSGPIGERFGSALILLGSDGLIEIDRDKRIVRLSAIGKEYLMSENLQPNDENP